MQAAMAKPKKILDGTPATFAAAIRDYSDLDYKTIVILQTTKPHTKPCVFCDEPGADYTIHAVVRQQDEEEGVVETPLSWPVHESHFHTEG
jgi:hypothetical protein